ncbi:MAG: type II secretion system protein M [Betaproteobacteria bacterium]|nr:type II secretion system protein M [Betaproteobacteria bacterium]
MKAWLIDWRDYILPFWQARTPRERMVLEVLGALVAAMAGYALLWQPAKTHVAQLERELPQLRVEQARMQAMAGELMLARSRGASKAPGGAELEGLLQQSLHDLRLPGLKAERRSDGRFTLEWREAPFSTMADWLDQARQKWRVTVVEGHVERALRPGNVNARLVLRGAE